MALAQIHLVVGSLVFIAYFVLTILNLLRVTGRDIAVVVPLARLAALLLLVQYLLGFALLGQRAQMTWVHFVLALLAIVTVGLEHGYAASRATPHQRAVAALIATLGTTILVGAAHVVGSSYVPTSALITGAPW